MKQGIAPILHLFMLTVIAGLSSCIGPAINDTPAEVETSRPEVGQAETGTSNQKDFPLLNQDNAEDFLTNYLTTEAGRNVALTTRYGTLVVKLFDDTPLHTANFLMMVNRAYFSGTEFTRIVPEFVVQGGNSERETDDIKRLLIGNYLIAPEIHDKYPHQKGALAMARSYDNNPEKRSSAYDFYLVVGRTFNEPQFMAMEREHDMTIPEWKRKIYREIGGAPHLDGQHTVFGQVVQGMEVLDRMGATPTDERHWPLESLIMQMEVLRD